MKAGLGLALWEVTTHVSIGGCLHIPCKVQQVVNRWSLNPELNCQEIYSVLSPNENFNIHLQRTLGHGILGEFAPSIMNA